MKFFKYLIIVSQLLSYIYSQPGTLISYNHKITASNSDIQQLVDLALGNNAPVALYNMSMYSIDYEIINPQGQIDTLSGLVSFPLNPTKIFPIASYQHGTTIEDDNVPSVTGLSISNQEVSLISMIMASTGFIIMLPDYAGLGSSEGYHPYIIAETYTPAITNMIRAVKYLSSELNLNNSFMYNNQLYLFGYSEGGYATLAAQRDIEQSMLNEFNLTASFPMAGPYDLSGTMVDFYLSINFYSQPYYVANVLFNHLHYYDTLDNLDQYFLPFWADTLPALFDGTHSGNQINSLMPDDPLEILLPETIADFSINTDNFFRQTLEENTLLDWAPISPTYLIHATADDIVPFTNSVVACSTFIQQGSESVYLIEMPESVGAHEDAAPSCLLTALDTILSYQLVNVKGDANLDGLINNIDYDLLIEYLVNSTTYDLSELWAGDIDFDTKLSIFDLISLSNIIENESD